MSEIKKPTIQFENVHLNKTEDLKKEIISFWTGLKILSQNEAENRVNQVQLLARNEQNIIIGVSTVYISPVPQFQNNMYIYRCLLHPDFRIPGLMQELTIQTIQYLESRFETSQPYCIGVMAKVESENLKKNRNVNTKTGLNFVGFAPDGDPIRVYFFKKAKF